MNNSLLDRAGVKAKFDVFPEQIIDYLALVGDSSDNIPGIDKVGPKTGAKLAAAVRHARRAASAASPRSPGKVGENLRAGLDDARAVAPPRDDPHRSRAAAVARGARRRARRTSRKLRELYTRYELRGAAAAARGRRGGQRAAGRAARRRRPRRLRPPARAGSSPTSPRHYETITRWEDFERWLAALGARRAVRLRHRDHEPRLHARRDRRRVLLHRAGHGRLRAAALTSTPARPSSSIARGCSRHCRPLLEDPARAKVGHNLKYDAHVLANARHHARRHALRHHARVVRVEQRRHPPRHGLRRAALPGHAHHQLRGGRRQGRQADLLRPGAASTRRPSTRPRTPT